MTAQLRETWKSRSSRERMFVLAFAAVVGAVAFVLLTYFADGARVRLGKSVTELRAQAKQLERQASELQRLRTLPNPVVSPRELRTLIDAEAHAAGLSRALLRVNAPGLNEVQVVFGSIAFADWLAWVANLQSQQIRLEACRIEALATPGLVSATATFVRAR